jgi:hypothetical protein
MISSEKSSLNNSDIISFTAESILLSKCSTSAEDDFEAAEKIRFREKFEKFISYGIFFWLGVIRFK